MKMLSKKIINKLIKKKLTISVAESCTGGLTTHMITTQSGSSKYLKGGVIAYSNQIKESLLTIPSETLKKHGAVSKEVAHAMAESIRKKFNTKFP